MPESDERREQLKEKLKSRLISNMNESEKQIDCEPEDLSMRCHQMGPQGVPDSHVNAAREPIQPPDTINGKLKPAALPKALYFLIACIINVYIFSC